VQVRLTGGEPTVRRDLVQLATELGALPGLHTLAITSNGLVLERSLQALHGAGLNAVNISLDTLRAETFEKLTRRKGLPNVLGAIERALHVGVPSVKVNVVVMRGINHDEVADFVELTRSKVRLVCTVAPRPSPPSPH
jgi:cyclic pyranopterin phosphate synthase